jgi:hypothetical protein
MNIGVNVAIYLLLELILMNYPAASCGVSVFRSQNTEAGMGQRQRPLLLISTEF